MKGKLGTSLVAVLVLLALIYAGGAWLGMSELVLRLMLLIVFWQVISCLRKVLR